MEDQNIRNGLEFWGGNVCDLHEEHLIAYNMGMLDQSETQSLMRHLRICRNCEKLALQICPSIFNLANSYTVDRSVWHKLKGKLLGLSSFDIQPALATRSTDYKSNNFPLNEVLNIFFDPPQNGSLLVLQQAPDDNISLLFPNAQSKNALVQKQEVIKIELIAKFPTGNYTVKAIFIPDNYGINLSFSEDISTVSNQITEIVNTVSKMDEVRVGELSFSIKE